MPSSNAHAFQLESVSMLTLLQALPQPCFLLSASPLAASLLPPPPAKLPPARSTAATPDSERGNEARAAVQLQPRRHKSLIEDDARTATGESSFDILSANRHIDSFRDSESRSESAFENEPNSAERILQTAFETQEVDSDSGEKFDPLVGGDQPSHDPLRTAEGAVTALNDRVKLREEADESQHQREELEISQGVERERAKEKWYILPPRVSEGGSAGGARLEELLQPVWENSEFTKLVGKKVSSEVGSAGGIPGDTSVSLNILDLLSRKEGQSLISLLTTALSPSTTQGSPSTTTLQLSFPPISTHNHVPSIAARRNVPLSSDSTPDKGLDTTFEITVSYLREHDLLVILGPLKNLPAPPLQVPFNSARPPFFSQSSTLSSISSTSTIIPTSTSATTVISPSYVLSPPLPQRISPTSPNMPLTAAFGLPIALPRQGTHDDVRPFPQGFLVERKRRRKHRARTNALELEQIVQPVAGGEQELSRADELAEGVAARIRKDDREAASSNGEEAEEELDSRGGGNSINGDVDDPLFSDDPNAIPPSPPSPPNDGAVTPLDASLVLSALRSPEKGTFEHALCKTPVGRLILRKDWSTTPLGAISAWSSELKMLVRLILASPMRESIWWGPEFTLICPSFLRSSS